jgi:hypothetical protein
MEKSERPEGKGALPATKHDTDNRYQDFEAKQLQGHCLSHTAHLRVVARKGKGSLGSQSEESLQKSRPIATTFWNKSCGTNRSQIRHVGQTFDMSLDARGILDATGQAEACIDRRSAQK